MRPMKQLIMMMWLASELTSEASLKAQVRDGFPEQDPVIENERCTEKGALRVWEIPVYRERIGECTGEECAGPISRPLYRYAAETWVYICSDTIYGHLVWQYACGFGTTMRETCEHRANECRSRIFCPLPTEITRIVMTPYVIPGKYEALDTCQERGISTPQQPWASITSTRHLLEAAISLNGESQENEWQVESRGAEEEGSAEYCRAQN